MGSGSSRANTGQATVPGHFRPLDADLDGPTGAELKSRPQTERGSAVDDIPNCELGESLDARQAVGAFQQRSVGFGPRIVGSGPGSAVSSQSADSGIHDLQDDYSHVITENSSSELVAEINQAFSVPFELELVMVGKAVPRLLSGYQRKRMEEQNVLQLLREEGLIATPSTTATSGLSFEIVDALGGDARRPGSAVQDRLPAVHLQKLEARRCRHARIIDPHADLRLKEQRRKVVEDERVRKIANKQQHIEEAKQKRSDNQEQQLVFRIGSAVNNRQRHLDELRQRLRDKHDHARQVLLKKSIRSHHPHNIPQDNPPTSPPVDNDDQFYN